MLSLLKMFVQTRNKTHSTEVVANDASAITPNLTMASCDLDLWPPDPESWPSHTVAPWIACANFQQNRFMDFSKYRVHKFDLCRPPVTLTFDLLTPKVDRFIPFHCGPFVSVCRQIGRTSII